MKNGHVKFYCKRHFLTWRFQLLYVNKKTQQVQQDVGITRVKYALCSKQLKLFLIENNVVQASSFLSFQVRNYWMDLLFDISFTTGLCNEVVAAWNDPGFKLHRCNNQHFSREMFCIVLLTSSTVCSRHVYALEKLVIFIMIYGFLYNSNTNTFPNKKIKNLFVLDLG